MQYSQEDIVQLISNETSRVQGFNVLVHQYSEKLYWVIRRILISHEDSDDVLQDVYSKIWLNLHSFKGESQLYTWLYRIAVNESLSCLRKKRNKFFLPLVDVENQLMNLIDRSPEFNGDEIEKRLQKAILQLPEKQRLVFNIRYYDEMKFSEMALVLGMTEGGVKSTYHIAVQKLKENLGVN